MKEIKAYIRRDKTNMVIQKLEQAGVKGMTVIDVSALCEWADKESFSYSIEYCEKYSKVVKLELVCDDSEADGLVEVISKYGRTGNRGDGMIFISPIEKAIHIRTGNVNIL
ncbi:MAG: P-II family nitrogen regulator [Bacteroidetes bacterium]|nr:P-II family nitrogen regulator [Bacteroidota bacterium]MBU2584402.1 P-II family nitrogen regulator [Bacteroidota bacterium]